GRPVAAVAWRAWPALLALVVAGCAATATQSWRTAPELSAPVWNITGTQGMWGNTVININDTPVMQGKISYWTGAGEMTGTYQDLPVTAKCKKGRGSQVRTACAVTVDGRKATTLYFRVK
ncbi:MAG: hypothetical protein ACREE7_16460, partial [Dongiaceae bacterium]